jgi:hypothetical protein
MNIQTEDKFEDIVGDHPAQIVNQVDSHYSPRPFSKVKESPDLYEKKSPIELLPEGYF